MRRPAFSQTEAAVVAQALDVLGCAPRLQMFTLIQQMGDARPVELLAALDHAGCTLSQPTVSHHLTKLADVDLVVGTRVGRTVVYQLTEYGQRVHKAVRGVR